MQKVKDQGTGNILEPFFDGILISIIADMKSRKLLQGYSTMNLDVSMYETHLYKVVFLLAGIKAIDQNDDLKDWYHKEIDKVHDVEISKQEKIREMAGDVLLELMRRKKK